MKINNLLITLLACMLSWNSHFLCAQSTADYTGLVIDGAKWGYYIEKGDSVVHHVQLYDYGVLENLHKMVVPTQPGYTTQTYYPHEIDEYGFTDGTRYLSVEVSLCGKKTTVFMEIVLEKPGLGIYRYMSPKCEDRYFITTGETLPRLMQPDDPTYRTYLQRLLADSCRTRQVLDKEPIELSEPSIRRIYEAYHSGNMYLYPKFTWGVVVNPGFATFNEGYAFSYSIGPAFSAGLFFNIPIDGLFCFRPECTIMGGRHHGTLEDRLIHGQIPKESTYLQLGMELPLLFRYEHNKSLHPVVPYMELGPLAAISFLDEYRSLYVENEAELEWNKRARALFGLALGTGIKWRITPLYALSFGVRYALLIGNGSERKENWYRYSLVLSTNF